MDKNYGGVIWTNHALSRLRERGISQGDAWATFNRPDFSRYAKSQNAYVYYKIYNDEKIEVVAKKNEKGQWLILSVWSKHTGKDQNFLKKENFMTNLITKFLDRFKKN